MAACPYDTGVGSDLKLFLWAGVTDGKPLAQAGRFPMNQFTEREKTLLGLVRPVVPQSLD